MGDSRGTPRGAQSFISTARFPLRVAPPPPCGCPQMGVSPIPAPITGETPFTFWAVQPIVSASALFGLWGEPAPSSLTMLASAARNRSRRAAGGAGAGDARVDQDRTMGSAERTTFRPRSVGFDPSAARLSVGCLSLCNSTDTLQPAD